jgi:opacity protein-like surface antigen
MSGGELTSAFACRGKARAAAPVAPGRAKEIGVKRRNAFFVEMILLAAVLVLGVEVARAEGFVELYIGGAFTSDASQSIKVEGTTASGSGKFDASFLSGGRGGYWLDSVPWLGFALTAAYYNVKEDVAVNEKSVFELDVVPISALLMLRYPLLKSADFPRGQVYPYLGVGPGIFVTTAKADVIGFEDTSVEVGADVRAGIAIFHPNQSWSIFMEYRYTYVGSSKFTDNVSGVPVTVKLGSLDTQSFVAGFGYHF